MTATLHLVPAACSASAWSCLFPLRCLAFGNLPVQRIEVGGQVSDQIAFGHVVAHADGAGEAQSVHPPVTLDHNAIEAQERPAVEATRVHAVAQGPQTALGEQCTEL